jgi:glucan biosynthesis protein C
MAIGDCMAAATATRVCRYPVVYGVLARHWARWLAAAPAPLFLWMGAHRFDDEWPGTHCGRDRRRTQLRAGLRDGCFFLIAISLHFVAKHSRPLDSLSADAYGLYLVHYNFVVRLQYALLGAALFAAIKAAIIFGGTLVLSWIAVLAVQRIPFGAQLIGTPRRAVATS